MLKSKYFRKEGEKKKKALLNVNTIFSRII